MKLILILFLFLPVVASADRLDDLKLEIMFKAFNADLDPFLVLAIVEVESEFKQTARGSRGEVGLFQLRKKFHGGDRFLASMRNNIDAGINYLVHIKMKCERDYGSAWFVCYNHGPNKRVMIPKQFPYYKKVMNVYEKYKAKISR